MGLVVRWMFCLIIVVAHWAHGPVAFADPHNVLKPGADMVDKVRRPIVAPKPVFRYPRRWVFGLQKPPPHLQALPPVYPVFKPWKVPAKPQTPHTKPSQLPSWGHGRLAPYWVKVPSPWYLSAQQQFQHVPGYVVPNPALQLYKPNVLPEKPVKPKREQHAFNVKPQIPKYQSIKGAPGAYRAESEHFSDLPKYLRFAPHNSGRYLTRYYFHPLQQKYPPPNFNYSAEGGPVLQKKQLPKLEWSWHQGKWVPKF